MTDIESTTRLIKTLMDKIQTMKEKIKHLEEKVEKLESKKDSSLKPEHSLIFND